MNVTVGAPCAGWLSALDEVPDAVFAGRMMGDGVALDPLEGVVRAPAAATVVTLASTGHAVTLRLENGADLLIHIGIDTVALGGAGFAPQVTPGQRVVAGQTLIVVDLDRVAAGARSLVTPILVAGEGFRIEAAALDRHVAAGDPLFTVIALDAAETETRQVPGEVIERAATVALEHGLHARPSARIGAALAGLAAEVTVLRGAQAADARSPVALLGLDLRLGEAVVLRGQGPAAAAALAAVAAVLESADPDAHATPVRATGAGGVCASGGLAVGPLAHLRLAASEVPADGRGAGPEQADLTRALKAAARRLGPGGIADAHRALLADPVLIAVAETAIVAGRSAAWAWRAATDAQAAQLRASANPRLAERAADLADVGAQVLTELGHGAVIAPVPPCAILVADDLLPTQFMALQAAGGLGGVCLVAGGPTAHVAILAAAAGVPMVVAMGAGVLAAAEGAAAILDADAARLDAAPDAAALTAARAEVAARAARARARAETALAPCRTADGTRIEIFANLGAASEAAPAVAAGAEGCGLLRSEFLFLDRAAPPTRAEQQASYGAVAAALAGRPLIVRTLDVGADKPLAYLPMPPEENPALGLRGIRLALARPELLRDQVAAILAAAPFGQCRIMLPMVVDVGELRAVRAIVDELAAAAGIAGRVPLGVMIETPAAAMLAGQLADPARGGADFLSIGTNDLTQYALAVDRGNPAVAAMVDALHPAVLGLVDVACRGAAAHGCPVGVCGSAAGDPVAAAVLVGLGVGELSMVAARIPAIKTLLRGLQRAELQALAARALDCAAAAEVRGLVSEALGAALAEAM